MTKSQPLDRSKRERLEKLATAIDKGDLATQNLILMGAIDFAQLKEERVLLEVRQAMRLRHLGLQPSAIKNEYIVRSIEILRPLVRNREDNSLIAAIARTQQAASTLVLDPVSNYEPAVRELKDAQVILQKAGNREELAWNYLQAGVINFLGGNREEAVSLIEQAIGEAGSNPFIVAAYQYLMVRFEKEPAGQQRRPAVALTRRIQAGLDLFLSCWLDTFLVPQPSGLRSRR